MRLINVKTHRLEDFPDHPPSYAILSHTWGDEAEELTLRDFQDGGNLSETKPGIGAVKFHGCCAQAERDGFQYAWIDTCCIDKTNLVELSEAINSMFRWYSDASVCYVYLSDVPPDDAPTKEGSKFLESRWFRRGWTLQELLAPENVRFYNADWTCIGTKGSLCAAIGKATGVPRHFLLGITDLQTASIAQRMSWAATRDTKKKEDLAYCLLGLFGVTMPLIYGEGGEQAFFRLQEQIMKTTRDDSLLAWGIMGAVEQPAVQDAEQVVPGRILAAGPADFANSGHIVQREQTSTSLNALTMSGGSLGINISMHTNPDGRSIGLLKCRPEHDDEHLVGIPLAKLAGLSDEYVRPKGDFTVLRAIESAVAPPTAIHIKHVSDKKVSKVPLDIRKFYWLYESDQLAEAHLSLLHVEPKSSWDQERALITAIMQSDDPAPHRTLARFRHEPKEKEGSDGTESADFVMILEFSDDGSGVKAECCVMTCRRSTKTGEISEKLDYFRQRASGTISASNGPLSLTVELEPVAQQPIFIIRPKAIDNTPECTINTTAELERFRLMLDFTSILQEKSQNDARDKRLSQEASQKTVDLDKIKKDREALEEQIRQLTDMRESLLVHESSLRAEVYRITDEQADIQYRQTDARDRWLEARQQWATLCGLATTDEIGYELEVMTTRTPLLWAAENGDVETVRLLLYQGVDVNQADQEGHTPFSVALEQGHVDIVRLILLTGKVNVNTKDENGQTPLILASATGSTWLVQLLLDTRKADVHVKDKYGYTAIRWAAGKKHEDIVDLLLKHGAAPQPQPLTQPSSPSSQQQPRPSQERARENVKTADYSKAIDSRLLDMLARTSSMGALRGKVSRASSDEKKPRARTWFSLEGRKAAQQQQQQPAQHINVSMVIAEGLEDGVLTERRRTT